MGLGVGAILWGVGVTGSGGRVAPLLLLATLLSGILASAVGVAAILNRWVLSLCIYLCTTCSILNHRERRRSLNAI